MGGGGEGDAKNGEPLQASRREREEASREDGSQAGILSELRDAKGQREKQAGPFHGAGMGDKPQVAHGGQGAQEVPSVPPPPPQASKWRLAAAAARLCPGMRESAPWEGDSSTPSAARGAVPAAEAHRAPTCFF